MSTIKLTSDGYSYHTLELKYHLKGTKYAKYLKQLYQAAKTSANGTIYPVNKYCGNNIKVHCCTLLSDSGVLLYFTKTKSTGCTIKAIVNPRKVLDPDADYLGIMPTDSNSFEYFQDCFTLLMRKYKLPDSLDEWQLTRVDLCVNILCSNKQSAREICRLLSKMMFRKKMERQFFLKPTTPFDQKAEMREKDKHSIKLSNQSYSVVIYDKLFQSVEECLHIPPSKKHQGILRIELQCQKRYLEKAADTHKLKSTTDLLRYMGNHSRNLILKHIKGIFPGGEHCKPKIAKTAIQNSGYHKGTRRQLEWLIQKLRYSYTMKTLQAKAEKKFSLSERTLNKRITQIQQLGINPIPLRSDFYLDRLPSLLYILETLEDDGCKITIDSDGRVEY